MYVYIEINILDYEILEVPNVYNQPRNTTFIPANTRPICRFHLRKSELRKNGGLRGGGASRDQYSSMHLMLRRTDEHNALPNIPSKI